MSEQGQADHRVRNRQLWTLVNQQFTDADAAARWDEASVTWGLFRIPEAGLGLLGDLDGARVAELGCGTAYFSAWLAKAGVRPFGIDLTPAQLETAREMQERHDLHFPLVEGNAEELPFADGSFDLALSEYGASIWCDPFKWIPEAARVLRPGGTLIFLRNSPMSQICTPAKGSVTESLQRPGFGIHRLEWEDEPPSVEFTLMHGEMVRLLRDCGFEIEALLELQAPPDAPQTKFEYMTVEWARQWPSEEIWRARKV